MTVKVGQIWKDNDPRMTYRRLKVLAIENGKAVVQDPRGMGARTRIRLDRFGSTRQTGYSLVEDVEEKGADHIHVWPFDEAPEEYRALSTSGGDEDWVALVPERLANSVPWLESGTPFGCCKVGSFPIKNGDVVFIGSHA